MTRSILKLLTTSSVAVLSAVSISSTSYAQDGRQIATQLDEIVVEAQKRQENIQDVPIPVSALNAKQIEQRFGRDIKELGSIAPNVIVDQIFGVATPAISIRGMQLNDGEKSFDPAVAVYLDGVYLQTTTGALLNVFNAEAVEVLRGPQNTLFGRNTIGGLVHVRRQEPTGEMEGKASATFGRFNRMDLKGVVNLPSFANDTMSTQFSVVSLNNGGYHQNVTLDEREGDARFMMLGGAFKYEPSDQAKIVARYDYIDDDSDSIPKTSLATTGDLLCGGPVGDLGCGRPNTDSDYHRETRQAFKRPAQFKGHSAIVNGEYNLSSGHDIYGVLAYRKSKEKVVDKWDGVEANLFYTYRPQNQEQFSAELRYQGEVDKAKWVLGGYYYDANYQNSQRTFFFPFDGPSGTDSRSDVINIFENTVVLAGEVPGTVVDHKAENISVFGQFEYNLTDKFTVTAGGRWLNEEKRFCSALGTGAPGVDISIDSGTRTLVAAYGDCSQTIKGSGVFVADRRDPLTNALSPQTGKKSWSKFTPKIGVDYKLDNGLLFASYSEGFRSGGFNGRATDPYSAGPYDPETVKNYEVGLKSTLADNRLKFNLTGFLTNYDDKQEDVVFPDAVAGTVTVVENAARAKISGLEAEITFVAADGLTFNSNIGYLNSKYDNYEVLTTNIDPATSAATPLVPVDKSGFALRRAPEFSFDIGANYEVPVGNDAFVILNGLYSWKDDYYIVANTITHHARNPGFVESHGKLDLAVTYERDNWKISAFGKNVTGVDRFTHVLDVATGLGGVPGDTTPIPTGGLWTYGTIAPPATWGVELGISF